MRQFLSVIFALVLLVASSLKAHALLFPDSPAGFLPIWMQWAGVAMEWAIAGWLLSGVARAWAHRASLVLLGIFILVAGARLLNGDSDCGCFGRVHVHPAWTLTLDLLLFLAFLWAAGRSLAPLEQAAAAHRLRLRYLPSRITTATALCLAVPLLIVPARSSDHITRIIINQPGSLVGKPFPLLPFLSEADRAALSRGKRTVILFSHDCDHCRNYLVELAAKARPSNVTRAPRPCVAHGNTGEAPVPQIDQASPIRIIDILNDSPDSGASTTWPFREIALRRDVRCIANVPLRIVLRDGIVKTIQQPQNN